MPLTKATGQKLPQEAVLTEPEQQAPQTDERDAEIEELRRQLAATQQQVVALESVPSTKRGKDIPEGMERVVPQGDFDLNYGGRKYVFKGGVATTIPQEVANHLKGVALADAATGEPITFVGNSLFRSTNA